MASILNMSTGKVIEDDFGAFSDQVLKAEWIAARPELRLGLQSIRTDSARSGYKPSPKGMIAGINPEIFLTAMYCSQR